MDQNQSAPPAPEDDENALESPDASNVPAESTPSTDGSGTIDATHGTPATSPEAPAPPKKGGLKQSLRRFNVYLLFFLLILVVAAGIILIAYFQSQKGNTTTSLKTQELTQQTLEQVAASDATVGSSGQILNVQSNAVFAGQVLVREGLQVAGNLQISGVVAFNNLTVSGTTQVGQLQVNGQLSVSGDAGLQGALTVAKSLQVNGGATFGGAVTAPQLTVGSLQLNGDITLTHHIVVGGPTPSRSGGAALGSGGSASLNGSDTAGSININTGSSPAAGCFVTITFTSKFSDTPHVNVTPVGSAAGGLDYYVTRSTTNFSICDASAPPAGASFGFDYFIVD
jgi:cytoskeletal protein CcmA (bactofilin family)